MATGLNVICNFEASNKMAVVITLFTEYVMIGFAQISGENIKLNFNGTPTKCFKCKS